jgi:hypothetical protein
MESSTASSQAPPSTAASAPASLTPSQALTSNKNTNKPRNRRGRGIGKAAAEGASTEASNMADSSSQQQTSENGGDKPNQPNNKKKRPPRKRGGPNKNTNTNEGNDGVATTENPPQKQNGKKKPQGKKNQPQQQQNKNDHQSSGNNNNQQPNAKGGKKRPPRKKYPWRRHIPEGTVDPITLDELVSLTYPPIALVATAPYIPVLIWPIPENPSAKIDNKEDLEALNRKRIEEQWGAGSKKPLVKQDERPAAANTETTPKEPSKRHYHLYDGRALAYYLVSQLQFIDPLNRRDLTRDELVNLDSYLKRNNLQGAKVVEAYDAKGITLSSAGAVAHTAQGRAHILQETARNLLSSLFGGTSVTAAAAPAPSSSQASTSSLQEQYSALQRQEEQARSQQATANSFNDADYGYGYGVFGSADGGLMVIDDDTNVGLGLRGTAPSFQPGTAYGNPSSLYSASHIAGRFGQGGSVQAAPNNAFPALPAPASGPAAKPAPASAATHQQPPKASKTLSRITKAVKKRDPEELQKQWEAREEARKRAMLSNLSFGVDPFATTNSFQPTTTLPSAPTRTVEASEEQLARNRNLAEALGVKPATVRQQFTSGWARPVTDQVETDEFGKELNAALYPDSLILQAREKVALLLKVEKRWKAFLADDSAASLPLNAMDRPSRAFVHAYSDFWKLRTESFDPQPKRYIHCVKMPDTYTPYPLLSDAARNWRGPTAQLDISKLPTGPDMTRLTVSDHPSQQTAGQITKSREMPPAPDRVPLPLKPRSQVPLDEAAARSVSAAAAAAAESQPSTTRFDSLFIGRERQKLDLAKRTVPLELPPFQPENEIFNIAEDIQARQVRLQEKTRKDREEADKKRRALEDVFASDSEDDEGRVGRSGGGNDDDSDWEEPKPLYTGSDEE